MIIFVFLCPYAPTVISRSGDMTCLQTRKNLDGSDYCAATIWCPVMSSSLMFCILSFQIKGRRRINKPILCYAWHLRVSTTHGSAQSVLLGASFARTCRCVSLVLIWT